MSNTKLNVEQICSIKIYRKSICRWYAYKEFKKSFWGDTKEGFYTINFHGTILVSKEQIEKAPELYCEGKEVFYYPHVVIKTSGGGSHTKYFKTEIELDLYLAGEVFLNLKLIEI